MLYSSLVSNKYCFCHIPILFSRRYDSESERIFSIYASDSIRDAIGTSLYPLETEEILGLTEGVYTCLSNPAVCALMSLVTSLKF